MINIQDTTARFKSIFNNVCKILNEYHKKMAIDTINELFSKLSSNQTTIMVCGEFKRGKSTFINALLDMSLCPTDEHIAENGGYPPTQNGDIRSLFWLFSLMALQN